MATKPGQLSNCDNLDCCDSKFNDSYSSETIKEKLNNLPKVRASKNFDQKMAAAFAIELEKENLRQNQSMLRKTCTDKISRYYHEF